MSCEIVWYGVPSNHISQLQGGTGRSVLMLETVKLGVMGRMRACYCPHSLSPKKAVKSEEMLLAEWGWWWLQSPILGRILGAVSEASGSFCFSTQTDSGLWLWWMDICGWWRGVGDTDDNTILLCFNAARQWSLIVTDGPGKTASKDTLGCHIVQLTNTNWRHCLIWNLWWTRYKICSICTMSSSWEGSEVCQNRLKRLSPY